MTFGTKIRDLRRIKDLTQRELAKILGINFTYLSKIENDKASPNQFPREDTIRKIAEALDADLDELLLLAQKIPDHIRERVIARPDAFRKIASLDDSTLDKLLKDVDE